MEIEVLTEYPCSAGVFCFNESQARIANNIIAHALKYGKVTIYDINPDPFVPPHHSTIENAMLRLVGMGYLYAHEVANGKTISRVFKARFALRRDFKRLE